MGIQDELEGVRKTPASKIDAWLESLTDDDREAFTSALAAPKEIFSHQDLAKVAIANGCDIAGESAIRRYRNKLQETK